VVSLAVMPTLAYAEQQTGRARRALQADAVETWVCAYLSLALLVGVGANLALGWWWADPVAALTMLPIIAWQGWETLEEARKAQSDSTKLPVGRGVRVRARAAGRGRRAAPRGHPRRRIAARAIVLDEPVRSGVLGGVRVLPLVAVTEGVDSGAPEKTFDVSLSGLRR